MKDEDIAMNSRPMSNIDKRALREAAERAESDSWGYDRDEFNEALTPSTVLALLDELEAKDKRLNEILTPNMLLPVIDDMDEDNLRHVIKTVCENYSLLHAKWEAEEKRAEVAEKRIAELQAREVKLPELKMLRDYLAEVTHREREDILVGVRLEFFRVLKEAGVKVAAAGKGEAS